jgi:hypothetical protein
MDWWYRWPIRGLIFKFGAISREGGRKRISPKKWFFPCKSVPEIVSEISAG